MTSLAIWIAQTLASAFLAVLFLQSGLDKVLDWKGNKEYVTGFLSKTPMARFAGFAFLQITLLEVLAGVLSAGGCLTVLLTKDASVALAGAALSGLTIVGLFLGQRLAKDYAAAAGMVPYGIFTIGAVLLQGLSA